MNRALAIALAVLAAGCSSDPADVPPPVLCDPGTREAWSLVSGGGLRNPHTALRRAPKADVLCSALPSNHVPAQPGLI